MKENEVSDKEYTNLEMLSIIVMAIIDLVQRGKQKRISLDEYYDDDELNCMIIDEMSILIDRVMYYLKEIIVLDFTTRFNLEILSRSKDLDKYILRAISNAVNEYLEKDEHFTLKVLSICAGSQELVAKAVISNIKRSAKKYAENFA